MPALEASAMLSAQSSRSPMSPGFAQADGRLGKARKVVGRAIEGSGGAIGKGSKRVAQQCAFLVHTQDYSASHTLRSSEASRLGKIAASLINLRF